MLSQKSFQDKNILILGFGKSGQSAYKLLSKTAKQIFIFDEKFKTKIQNNKKNNCFINKNNLFYKNINFLEENFNNVFIINNLKKFLQTTKIHFCILSPGISVHSKYVKIIKQFEIRIVSELELGAIFTKGKIIAITGTNGKTTTVNALYHILKSSNKETFLCGNVGTPISQIAPFTTSKSFVVVEVSSFQLQSSKNFRPDFAAILNIQPDHLDHHKTLKEYTACKTKIFDYHKTKKILNFDDLITKKLSQKNLNSKFFSIKNKKIYKNKLKLIKNNNLVGKYNLSNLMCAYELSIWAGVKKDQIASAIKAFLPLEHRLEFVAKTDNITFINDSKSTNIASTISALDAMENQTILLLGGAEKNLDFSSLNNQKFEYAVCYGECGQRIYEILKRHKHVFLEKKLEEAFNKAVLTAKNISTPITILLSPATSSFDEFTGFEERGEAFKMLVKNYISKS